MSKRSSPLSRSETSVYGAKQARKSASPVSLARAAPRPLLELSARVVAAKIPYELVEDRCVPVVPEPVTRLLIKYAIPRSEDDVRRYTSTSITRQNGSSSGRRDDDEHENTLRRSAHPHYGTSHHHGHQHRSSSNSNSSSSNVAGQYVEQNHDRNFKLGVRLAEAGSVSSTLQIGEL